MKVNEILSNGKITLSFEVFPPKTDAQFESVRQATIDVAALKPSYMSVTYGAGGNTRKNTVAIAKGIQDTTGVNDDCPFNMCRPQQRKIFITH